MNRNHSLPPLLGPDDPPAFRVEEDTGRRPLLLVCDHASNRLPARLGDLGLAEEYRQRHIALDIGAAGLTRQLARRLEGPAVYCGYSRLVIDCNRQPGDPTSIPPVSDGVIVPGNQDLGDLEADQRADEVFWPYHHAVGQTLAHLWRRGTPPALISVHSFTPVMNGFERPWQVGILWNHDPRLAVPLIHRLRANPHLCVGDNEPYSGRQVGFTVEHHAAAAGLPHVVLEVRQDLISTDRGQEEWADLLGDALEAVLADADLHRVQHF